MPQHEDPDYHSNDYDVFKFLSLQKENIVHEIEITRRIRLGMLAVEPSKLEKYQPEVQQFGKEVVNLLQVAKEEAVTRWKRCSVNASQSKAINLTHLEFTEKFQAAALHMFHPTLMGLCISELRFDTVAAQRHIARHDLPLPASSGSPDFILWSFLL